MWSIKVYWEHNLLVFIMSPFLQLFLQRKSRFSGKLCSGFAQVFNARPTFMVLNGVFTLMGVVLFFFFFNLNVDEALNFALFQWRAVTTRCCFQKNNCSFLHATSHIYSGFWLLLSWLCRVSRGGIHITPAQQRCFSSWKPLNSAQTP